MTELEQKVLDQITEAEVVALLQEITRINTVNPPGNEAALAQVLKAKLDQEGIPAELQYVTENRANLIATLAGTGTGPTLLYNAHMDTVPVGDRANWKVDPFAGEIIDGKIYGRGVADDKQGVAAMIMAAIALKRAKVPLKGTLLVTPVMGEETGNIGTLHLLENGLQADMAVVGEWSSHRKIALGYRGSLWFKLKTYGKTAHGSRPSFGINAIDHMTELVLPHLKSLTFDYEPTEIFLINYPTLSVNVISGGVKTNVVPDYCEVEVDMRLVPGQKPAEVEAQIRAALKNLEKLHPDLHVEMEVFEQSFPFQTPVDSELVQVLTQAVTDVTGEAPEYMGKTGCSDANPLSAAGIPVVAFGPGNPSGHEPNEWVEIADLVKVTEILALHALRICG